MPGEGSGLAVGLRKGFLVEKRTLAVRPSRKKGRSTKKVKLVRDVIREIAGVSPLERRGMELLKNGRDKRVLKLCKKRLGTHKRAKAKREQCHSMLRAAQRKAAK
ncbi:large subunit ribosomal protein L36e, cytoplasmic [Guillardia theta CCMP2712]|uniref:Large subunit ribosomal protein L36e, cytoplasmic n=1 Tax=Guillardia theta (strain CCMP2712) TaxID=905079 RepID=L1IFE6_GUITC|nr:large subunit ribosomal protein L36e, cytoplasmic [Guillardia theta CCMP2712]EKX34580.1 large subunit ribosomal protein L36e, cytoplasmic [Guillardia theta CCMP2712]|eukprot:XP_005821560.1 large subunit ribosomal protein L36e, cytoplasmic [Guillardia theta CCMP2712]